MESVSAATACASADVACAWLWLTVHGLSFGHSLHAPRKQKPEKHSAEDVHRCVRPRRQLFVHGDDGASLLNMPRSHCSPGVTMPSPHEGFRVAAKIQRAEQPSESTVLPSSHCSPGPRVPSPQRAAMSSLTHKELQPSLLRRLPSSHSSPWVRTASPHAASFSLPQVPLQPSRSTVF